MPIVVGISPSGTGGGNYSNLIQWVLDILKDDSLEPFVPDMVMWAERLFDRILYPLNDEETVTITTTADTITSTLPDDFKRIRTMYKGTDRKVILPQMSPDDLETAFVQLSNAQPEAFALTVDSIYWGPIPDDAYDFTMIYVQGLQPLSQSNQTNWLIEKHPDVYLHGTLAYAEMFGWNDERSQWFMENTLDILKQIQFWDAQRRRGENHASVAAVYF